MSNYILGKLLGEGTWGQVYEGFRDDDDTKVAIKIIKSRDEHLGLNFTALREIKYLKRSNHPNIVKLKETFLKNNKLHLVMEHCPYDLLKIIRDKSIVLSEGQIKTYMKMLLSAISYLHSHFILHRDLAPGNLLIAHDGSLKLADFGLAREYGSPKKMTNEVVTRWYRAPELFYGCRVYGPGIDMWAVGCIFGEILLRVPLFPGDDNEIDQLKKIFNVLGTPDETIWPGVSLMPNYVEFEPKQPIALRLGEAENSPELDLLLQMLKLNPNQRISAQQALESEFLTKGSLPCQLSELPNPSTLSNKRSLPPSAQVSFKK